MSDNSKISYEGDLSISEVENNKDLIRIADYVMERALAKELTEEVDKEVMEYCNGDKHGKYAYTSYLTKEIKEANKKEYPGISKEEKE